MNVNLYGQPIAWMVADILLVPLVWALITQEASRKYAIERILNWSLLLSGIYVILKYTLLNRTADLRSGFMSLPFQLFWFALHTNREIARSLLLNILLFTPLGAALGNLLPQRFSVRKRILLTCVVGMILSALVESCQYYYSLGNAEADDVICNTLGTLIGAISLPIKESFKQ